MDLVTGKSIQITVAENITNAGPRVASIVVDTLVDIEIEKRKNAIITGLAALDKLRKEFKSHKPDSVLFTLDTDGKRVPAESWTKDALEKNDGESYSKLIDASK